MAGDAAGRAATLAATSSHRRGGFIVSSARAVSSMPGAGISYAPQKEALHSPETALLPD